MTDAEYQRRLAKFKRCAPHVASREHLDKILASFPQEHREIAVQACSHVLPAAAFQDIAAQLAVIAVGKLETNG